MIVRKNAATLSATEWENLMKAIIALKHLYYAGSNVSVYDQFVAIHVAVTRINTGLQAGINGAHGRAGFLPWHREYLRRYESALRSVDPRVSLPYWNWGLGSPSDTSTLFQDGRMGPLGTGGASGAEITTGYLAESPNTFNPMGWTIHQTLRPFGSALRRNSSLVGLPPASSINSALMQSNYNEFRPSLESPHGTVHVRVGWDMGRMTSPNDPIFFLHHCQIDRIWAKWQETHPGTANYNPAGSGGAGHRPNDPMWPWDGNASGVGLAQDGTTPLDDLIPNYAQTDIVRTTDVLDHREMGYCYDDESNCPCGGDSESTPPDITTLAFGEEGQPTLIRGEDIPTTLALGEEGPTLFRGENQPTSLALGEEGPFPTRFNGEGGPSNIIAEDQGPVFERGDDPFGNF